jgi:hypothetical protein
MSFLPAKSEFLQQNIHKESVEKTLSLFNQTNDASKIGLAQEIIVDKEWLTHCVNVANKMFEGYETELSSLEVQNKKLALTVEEYKKKHGNLDSKAISYIQSQMRQVIPINPSTDVANRIKQRAIQAEKKVLGLI